MRALLSTLAVAVALAGCSTPPDLGFAIAATLELGSSVSDAELARIARYEFDASGDQPYTDTVSLTRPALRTERVGYYPGNATRSLQLTVLALDGSGAVIARGSTPTLSLTPGQTTDVTIALEAPLVSVDAGVDQAMPDGAAHFCAGSLHTLCADFDEGDLLAGWDTPAIDPKGSVVPSTLHAVSVPTAARASMQRRSGTDPVAYATLVKNWPGWKRARVELDLYLATPTFQSGDVNSGVVVLSYYADGNGKSVTVSVGDGYTTVATPGTPVNLDTWKYDDWVHVTIDLDPTGHVLVDIGGMVVDQSFAAFTTGAMLDIQLKLGISGYNRPAPAYDAFYDNVTVDLQ